jgi:pyridoxine 4-dehydrogenase
MGRIYLHMSDIAKTFKLGGDLEINRLGVWSYAHRRRRVWGEPKDAENSKRVLKRAVELGVNFIDTSDAYGPAVSERLIGEALAPYANGVVIATKGGLTRQGPNKWAPVGRSEYLIQQVELSLRYLKTEAIDLWQLHRIDPKTPVEESLGTMKELQKQGKIRHIGLSEVKVPEIEQARKVVEIVSVQNKYNLSDRAHEDVLEYCTEAQHCIYPVVPGCGRQAGAAWRRAGCGGEEAWGDGKPACLWRGCCITRR